MDTRAYFSLEASLNRRLLKAWHELADPIFEKIREAVEAENWDKARTLVFELDMAPVGVENREWIKYMLRSFAVWGAAKVAGDDPTFVATGAHDATLNRVTDLTLRYLANNATSEVRDRTLQLIATAQGPTKKADLSPEQYRSQVEASMNPEFAAGMNPNRNNDDFNALKRHFAFKVENEVQRFKYRIEAPVSVRDKSVEYLATSGLQKAIRRGDVQQAQRLAQACMKCDSYYAWRRLNTFALEDVGMGDLSTTAMVLATCNDMALRKKCGEEPLMMYLVSELAQATKDRSNDDILCLGTYGRKNEYKQEAEEISQLAKLKLCELCCDSGASLPRRSLAIQELFNRSRADQDFSEYSAVVESLNIPPLAQFAALMGSYKRVDDLASTFPLTASLCGQSQASAIQVPYLAPSETIDGLPDYAFDMYTRTGRSSLAYLSKSGDNVRSFFEENAVTNRPDAMGLALFANDGALLGRRVVWDMTAKLEEEVEKCAFSTVGLAYNQGRKLREAMALDYPALQKARVRVYEREKTEAALKAEKATKYKFGSTQINMPSGPASDQMNKLRAEIPKHHLAGDGKNVDGNHVTVRYGIQDLDTSGIEAYLRSLQPFKAKLGPSIFFEPSEHSDGAMPWVASVESPELLQINKELAKYGSFTEPSFEYTPHATIAYIDPAVKWVYEGVEGGDAEFDVTHIMVSDRMGKKIVVPLEGTVQKADDSYLKPFVSFGDGGDSQLQLISSLNASRMATWGFVAEADLRNVRQYHIVGVMDARQCPFCAEITREDRIFEIDDARELVNRALSVEDPDDLINIQPWPSQSEDAIAEFHDQDVDELVAQGLQIPPYHPNDRCTLEMVNVPEPAETRLPEQAVQQPAPKIPKTVTAQATFDELGIQATEDQVAKWNAAMGISPTEVLAILSGKTPAEVLEDLSGLDISFLKNGDISTSVETQVGDLAVSAGLDYDPLSGKLYLMSADITGGTEEEQTEALAQKLGASLDIGTSVGAKELVVEAGDESAVALGKIGFLPSSLDWQYMRADAEEKLAGDLRDDYKALTIDQQQTLTALLQSNDETGFGVIAQLDFNLGSENVADALFGDVKGKFSLNLNDADAVSQAQKYLGDV